MYVGEFLRVRVHLCVCVHVDASRRPWRLPLRMTVVLCLDTGLSLACITEPTGQKFTCFHLCSPGIRSRCQLSPPSFLCELCAQSSGPHHRLHLLSYLHRLKEYSWIRWGRQMHHRGRQSTWSYQGTARKAGTKETITLGSWIPESSS